MKTTRQKTDLVPVKQALDGFEKLFVSVIPETKQDHVWAEPQLFFLPFCVPQDAERFRTIRIEETIRDGDQVKQRVFKVNPDPDFGLPGPFELEVMIVIFQIADEYMAIHGEVPIRLSLGSFRSFLKRMGRPMTGKYADILKQALKRLAATTCVSEGFFYSKPRDLYVIKSFQFITAAYIAGEDDHNGGRFDTTAIEFHDFIRENLNSKFRTLIDFAFIRSLKKGISKSLSLHLLYRFYKEGKSTWTADYVWIANRLGLKLQTDLRRAKDQLRDALNELKATGFLEEWEWLPNWRIRFQAGYACVQQHKERVERQDAWLQHQQKEAKQLTLFPPRTVREAQRLAAFDPLAAICAEYAVNGWTSAVSLKAKSKGLTQDALKAEAIQRGHCLRTGDTPAGQVRHSARPCHPEVRHSASQR